MIIVIFEAHLREDEMWVEEQVVGDRGVVGNTEEGHEPGDGLCHDDHDDHGDGDGDEREGWLATLRRGMNLTIMVMIMMTNRTTMIMKVVFMMIVGLPRRMRIERYAKRSCR